MRHNVAVGVVGVAAEVSPHHGWRAVGVKVCSLLQHGKVQGVHKVDAHVLQINQTAQAVLLLLGRHTHTMSVIILYRQCAMLGVCQDDNAKLQCLSFWRVLEDVIALLWNCVQPCHHEPQAATSSHASSSSTQLTSVVVGSSVKCHSHSACSRQLESGSSAKLL